MGSLILALKALVSSGTGAEFASILASIFTRDCAADAFVACADGI